MSLESKTLIETALREHEPKLRLYVHARAQFADIDDILQIAAMRAIENANKLRDSEKVLAWLYRIHRNVIVDVGRKIAAESRLKDALAAEPFPLVDEKNATCHCSVSQARQLNSRYSAILSMVDIGGSSLREAAKELGVTVNTATVRLHRARAALKQRLLSHCGIKTMQECLDCMCSYKGCC